MINDFGVPISDAEMSMQPPGSIKPHQEIMAAAGTEKQWVTAALTGASLGLSILSGRSSRNQAKKAKNTEEAFLLKKYLEYDIPLWEMTQEKAEADRDYLIKQIELRHQNEKDRAAFTDKNNLRNWQQSLKIRDYQIKQNERLYNKSEQLYSQALGLNRESAVDARQQTMLQLQETKQSIAFDNEAQIIESIIEKGAQEAKGQTGRSLAKQAQSLLADRGRKQAILTESLFSANRSTRMQLKDIDRNYRAANAKAYANRMLKPEAPPMPLKPLETPVSKYMLPREFIDADFGPKPIQGISSVQVPSMTSVLTGALSSGLSTFANNYKGTSSFSYDYGAASKSISTSGFGGDFFTQTANNSPNYNYF